MLLSVLPEMAVRERSARGGGLRGGLCGGPPEGVAVIVVGVNMRHSRLRDGGCGLLISALISFGFVWRRSWVVELIHV